MREIVLNEDLIYDLNGEISYFKILNNSMIDRSGRLGDILELKVKFVIDILQSRFRSLLKKIEEFEDKQNIQALLIVDLSYNFNTKDDTIKLIKDNTEYYIKGDYILKNEKVLSDVKDRLMATYDEIKSSINGNKFFKVIEVESDDSKSYEDKLSEIIEVEKEAITLCEKVKVRKYFIDVNEYITQYDYEPDDDFDEEEESLTYSEALYHDVQDLIKAVTQLSDSNNNTRVDEYWDDRDNVTFIVTEKNYLYYYYVDYDEDYNAEEVFECINRDLIDNFTGIELSSRAEVQNSIVDDWLLRCIEDRYVEVVLNKEDYLHDIKSMTDEISEEIEETYAKLESLIYSNGF